MTPTVHQLSAPIARPRLLELSRQIAVDFQPDADFDERGRCPGHGFLPFVGQYHSRTSTYPGRRRIQEIKIIAFVYNPSSRFHADLSARPTGIALPPRHAHSYDQAPRARGDRRAGSLLPPCKSIVGNVPQPKGPPHCQRCRQAPLWFHRVYQLSKRGNPSWGANAKRSCPFHLSPRPSPTSCLSTRPHQRYLEADSPSARSAFLTSAWPSRPAKGRSCK